MEFHPIADAFPLIHGQEFADLVADIRANGLHEPIWIYEDQILDGRNRFLACYEAGIYPDFREYLGDDPIGFVVSLNLRRRHLDESQRGMVAGRLANLGWGQRADRPANWPLLPGIAAPVAPITQAQAADMLNVGERTVRRSREVLDAGSPELIAAVDAGDVAVSTAATITALPQAEQTEVVAKGRDEILRAAKQIREQDAADKRSRFDVLRAEPVPPPAGKYSCIVIDPPWPVAHIDRAVRPNQVEFDYPMMSEEELLAFDLPAFAADEAHLYLWTTHKHLPLALRLAEHWGFNYECLMTWVKNVGFTPYSWMRSTEHVLFCRRGGLRLDRLGLRLDFTAKVREHSRKPEEFYDLIRQVSPGPRIDVFSRESREGFDMWGNEAGKFDADLAI